MSLKGALVAREHPLLDRLASRLDIAKQGAEELLWPTRCVLCDVPGTLLCEECPPRDPLISMRSMLARIAARRTESSPASIATPSWSRIAQLAPEQHSSTHGDQGLLHEGGISFMGSQCATEAQRARMPDEPQRALDKVVSVFSFVDPCRKLITVYKDKNELRAREVLAEMLANYVDPSWVVPGETALVVVPARKQASSRAWVRPHDRSGPAPIEALWLAASRYIAHGRSQRSARAFCFKPPAEYEGFVRVQPRRACCARQEWYLSRRSFVDDVLTTGATLMAAASVLKEAGIEQVFGLTVAAAALR